MRYQNTSCNRSEQVDLLRSSFPCCLPNRLHGRCIVRLTKLIGDILDVDDTVVAIKRKDGPLKQAPFYNPHAIVQAELLAVLGREQLVQYTGTVLPLSLHLWRV